MAVCHFGSSSTQLCLGNCRWGRNRMGAQLPASQVSEGAEDRLLLGILLGTLAVGFVLGFLALWGVWWLCARKEKPKVNSQGERWAQIVTRALRFIRRRRRIALAFSNYREHPLRRDTPAKGKSKPKARAQARNISPLREGPVYHGAYERRVSGNLND